MQTQHKAYFEAIQKHPRLLVGQEVPKPGGEEGEMETLRDSSDAEEWQNAVKSILVEEVKDRASRAIEDSRDSLAVVHQSIEVFQNNADLMPRTKDFDKELADQFTKTAKPFEVRVDGKLRGWSVPVQGLIDNAREEITARRAANPTPPAAGTPAAPAAPVDGPQAGLTSQAGNSTDAADDWQSALFGTLGLPNLRI